MKSVKKGISIGVTAFFAIETYAFLRVIDKRIFKVIFEKVEGQDAEKKEEAAEE